ncbi:MAG: hypothetical protein ABJJ37_20555, partial [Roseibium sp.]
MPKTGGLTTAEHTRCAPAGRIEPYSCDLAEGSEVGPINIRPVKLLVLSTLLFVRGNQPVCEDLCGAGAALGAGDEKKGI